MYKIISIIIISLLTSIIAPSIYAEEQSARLTTQAIKAQKISIENFTFTPQQLTIPVGTMVIWTNNDTVLHDVTFEKFGSKKLSNGETFNHIFAAKGTYSYVCTIHPSMKGEVIVK